MSHNITLAKYCEGKNGTSFTAYPHICSSRGNIHPAPTPPPPPWLSVPLPLPARLPLGVGAGGGAVIPPRRAAAVASAPSAAGALPRSALGLASGRAPRPRRRRAVGRPPRRLPASSVGCGACRAPPALWAVAPAVRASRAATSRARRRPPPLLPLFARPLGAPPGRPRRGARRSGGGCVLRRPRPPPAAVFLPPAACAAARRAVPSCWCGYVWAVLGGGGRVLGSLRVRALRGNCDFCPSHPSPLSFRPPPCVLPRGGGRRSLPPFDGAPKRGCRSCHRLRSSGCTNI